MQHPLRLSLSLVFPGAAHVFSAVRPDTADRFERSKTELRLEGNALCLSIAAADPTALRASFNSCMNAIILSQKLLEVV